MQTKIINFAKYSSIKIGPTVEVELINHIQKTNKIIIGGANNLLISNNPPKLCMLGKEFDYIKIENNRLIIGASTKSGKIFHFCKKNNISGFEFLNKLPGKLGGIIKMNAGVKSYEIFDNLISLKTIQGDIKKENINFGYRYCKISDIIFEATFKINKGFNKDLVKDLNNLRNNQPNLTKYPNAGSAFKNPENDYAGRLIEAVGLKGYKIGDAMFSNIHANFLINTNKATFNDMISLIDEAKKRVKNCFDIILEEEIKIIKDQNEIS